MQRMRIVSVVEDTWGCGIVYGDEPEKEIKNDTFPEDVVILSKISLQNKDEYDDFEQNDTDEEAPDSDYSLTYLQASLFATVLEDTLMDLRILVECNNEMRVLKADVDMIMLIANKYDIAQPATIDELDGINPHMLGCNAYKLNKLDADRLRRELNKQLRQRRNHITSVVYDADSTIDKLKMLVEDAPLNAEVRSRYVDNWQRARTEQHLQTIEDQEAKPSRVIEYYKRRTDYEQRVHSEVELLTNITINETLAKVESWMEKYDKDMEGLDLKIQIKKNDYQDMLERRLEFEETIEKHDNMMKEWIEFKEVREKARQYHKKMTESAIIVQAWWRGLLVRCQLGPFKVAKKKGGGADAKKKKK
ncbi:dynein regulatory complex protein 9-like isoform X3 [Epargyreus clarus]|uniref:dynein regulatory complex protein 9-like isoform X3 n=1 Tax=Epargyreus clarus TaxID=520877 RepID=UPI003C2B2DB5